MNREEHLAWAKERALACLDAEGVVMALNSMVSDLSKHEELKDHPFTQVAIGLLVQFSLPPATMLRLINSFE